jgi:hypothetical protein
VAREYPAKRYVLIDDKERILDAVKKVWGDRLVTVFPRQGHYAHDPANVGKYRKPDVGSGSAICWRWISRRWWRAEAAVLTRSTRCRLSVYSRAGALEDAL